MKYIFEADIPVSRRKIVEFGVVMFAVLGVIIPLFVTWRNGWDWLPWLSASVGIGATLLLLCVTTGMMMAPVYRAWMRVALLLGTIMTTLIVTVVFVIIITPIGLIRRLLRSRSDYTKRFDRSVGSYWIDRADDDNPSRMEKMY